MAEQVKGTYTQLSDSDHLCADDLATDKEICVTIESASIETVTAPNNQKKQMICLSFKGAKKKLPLNRTNGRTIAKITGATEVEKWPGHKICLYRTTIKAFGDPQLPAIRVRAPNQQGVKQ